VNFIMQDSPVVNLKEARNGEELARVPIDSQYGNSHETGRLYWPQYPWMMVLDSEGGETRLGKRPEMDFNCPVRVDGSDKTPYLNSWRAATGVVIHTGRMARIAWWRHMSILRISPLILGDTSLDGCAHDGLIAPGYHAPAPWSKTGTTHAWTASRTAAGSGPCFVFVGRYATARALAIHFSTCVSKDRVGSSQIPSHRSAAPDCFLRLPCRIAGVFLAGRLEKCITSVLSGSKAIPFGVYGSFMQRYPLTKLI